MNFKDAQRLSGQLPDMISTATSSYFWGSGPAWDSAIILIPWYMYEYCLDKDILRDMYDSMNLYMDFLNSMADQGIVGFGLGDWCYPKNSLHKDCQTEITIQGIIMQMLL